MTGVYLPDISVIFLRTLLKYILIPNVFEFFIEEEGEYYNEYADRNGFGT